MSVPKELDPGTLPLLDPTLPEALFELLARQPTPPKKPSPVSLFHCWLSAPGFVFPTRKCVAASRALFARTAACAALLVSADRRAAVPQWFTPPWQTVPQARTHAS